MTKLLLLSASALTLAACSAAQQSQVQSTVDTAVVAGQQFCAIESAAGPVVVQLVNALDSSAITVTGKTASAVAALCAAASGIPVSPPPSPATAPVVAVVVPASP